MTAVETHDPTMGREIRRQRARNAVLQDLQTPGALQRGAQIPLPQHIECRLRPARARVPTPSRRCFPLVVLTVQGASLHGAIAGSLRGTR